MSSRDTPEWQAVLKRQHELRDEYDDPYGIDHLVYERRKADDPELQRLLDEWRRSRHAS